MLSSRVQRSSSTAFRSANRFMSHVPRLWQHFAGRNCCVSSLAPLRRVIASHLCGARLWRFPAFRLYSTQQRSLNPESRTVDSAVDACVRPIGKDDEPNKAIPLSEPIPIPAGPTATESVISQLNTLQCTQLVDGVKVASVDRGGYLTNLGLYVNCGTRWEDDATRGCSKFLEHMAFQTSQKMTWLRTAKTLERLGAQVQCTAGREHMEYHVEVERAYVPAVLPILTANVLSPKFVPEDVDRRVEDFIRDVMPARSAIDNQITEALHATAWRSNTLGNPLTPPNVANYTPTKLRQFMNSHYSPKRMLLVGVNVEHDTLQNLAMASFSDTANRELLESTTCEPQPSRYTGGETRIHLPEEPLCHLAIGFGTPGGWGSQDLVALAVLQMVMGGGGAFSTGGPGKGMYTRLYLEVLATNWVESCTCFNVQYSDAGLFGLYIVAPPTHGLLMVHALGDQFRKMSVVMQDELKRAKNALKSAVWMNLESRTVLLDDIAKQLLLSGTVLSGQELCALIDQTTPMHIRRAVEKMFQTPATVVALGDLEAMPRYDAMLKILNC